MLLVFFCVNTSASFAQTDNLADIAVIDREPTNRAQITHAPGTTTERWPWALGQDRATSFLAADFNGDGPDDISCIDFDANDDAKVFVTQSPGQSANEEVLWQSALRASNELTFYFMPGDFDGDGAFDIAALYLQNSGDDNDVYAKITYGPDGSSQTVGNLDWQMPSERDSAFVSGRFLPSASGDNDQIYDIGAISRAGQDYLVKFYKGPDGVLDLDYQWVITSPSSLESLVAFRSGDLNGDGNTDVVGVFYNADFGEYNARVVFGPDGSTSQSWDLGDTLLEAILVHDFNGDGIDDIAAINNDNANRAATIALGSETGTVSAYLTWGLESNLTNVTAYLSGFFDRPSYSISGTVYQADSSTGLAYVTVSAGQGLTAVTDQNGNYTIPNVPNGTYTVSVTKYGHDFTPLSRVVNINEASVTGIDFDTDGANPPIFSISGKVFQLGGSDGLKGARIETDTGLFAITDAAGNYTISNIASGNYIITVSKSDHSFNPMSQMVIVNGADVVGKNFTATVNPAVYTLSGTILRADGVTGLSGVLVSAGVGLNATTDSSGSFIISGIASGTYLVSATKMGFTFSPGANQSVVVNGENKTGILFTALVEPKVSIRGSLSIGGSQNVNGAVIKAGNYLAVTSSNGTYEIKNVPFGQYQLSATLSGYQFSPVNFSNPISVVYGDLNGLDFAASCSKDFNLVGNVCVRDGNAPAAPSNLIASKGTSGSYVTVSWGVAESATSYQLYRSQYPGDPGVPIGDPIAMNGIQDKTAIPGVQYYYTVRGINSVGMGPFSNTDPGFRISDAEEPDCDGDGVSDAQEIEDGTEVCDGGSQQLHLTSPIFTGYNTFLSQYSFLELVSSGTAAAHGVVSFYANNGTLIHSMPFRIEPLDQLDININQIATVADTYGVIKIEYNHEDAGADLKGRMTHYRLNPSGDGFSFAYSKEFRNAMRGLTYATANSMDPLGGGKVVFNWAEIINVESVSATFSYKLYDQAGTQVGTTKTVRIAPFGRFDLQAGHEDGEGVYLAEFLPQEGDYRYLAGVSRYGNTPTEASNPLDYTFAFRANARAGSGEQQYTMVTNERGTCWSQSNWVELANVRGKAVVASLVFRDRNGAQMASTSVPVPALSMHHLNASDLVPIGTIGSLEITSSDAGALVAESVVYFNDCEANELQTAYNIGARPSGLDFQVGSYNKFVNQNNLLRVLNVGSTAANFVLDVNAHGLLSNRQIHSIGANSMAVMNLSDSGQFSVSADAFGTTTITGDSPRTLIGNNLRMRETLDGKVEFAIPTPLQ